ncbi:uncharacterized protein Triagg1_4847 [Trichoderma aggressivum f. europaeum]|uniref:Peptidase S8/S53 domain-containing protein n=1 Tax=Trichoderma aggressivum f. europaeum TaxID=173218 RepID=A0AAE1IDU5_9HYPO|nr:hypothetical protein Triagg1_4847 [Trichoderma aggressivum f. europaeum]
MSDIGELELESLNLNEPDQTEHLGTEANDSLEISEEEKTWKSQDLDQQCKDVLNLLSQNKRCWDSNNGSGDIPPLEEYKKQTLAEKRGDSKDLTRLTALHVLARSKQEFYQARKDVRIQLVGYLLENRANDSEEIRSSGAVNKMLVFEVALYYENDEFIECVEECLGNKFQDFLHLQDDEGKNCIHHLFSWPLERCGKTLLPQKSAEENMLYLNQLRRLALKAKPQTLATADGKGNTPIHYAMHVKQCNDRGDDYADIVKILIIRADKFMVNNKTLFNNERESPIMYLRNIVIATREEGKKRQRANQKEQLNQKSVSSAKGQKDLNQVQRPESRAESQVEESGPLKKSLKLANQGISMTGKQNIRSQVIGDQIIKNHGPIMNHSISSMATGPFPEGHRLQKTATSEISPDSTLFQRQHQMLPPGRKREPPIPSAQANDGLNAGDAKLARVNAAPTATTATNSQRATILLSDFLKKYYTGTRSDLDARDLIYGRGAEGWATNLYFDARGIQETKKILELLDRMKAGGFGTTLSYVSIPAIRHIPTVPSTADNLDPRDRGISLENPRPGRTDLIDVFNKLRELKVTQILRLEVEDRQAPSHMDAAIERAIQGRDSADDQFSRRPIGVHTWDWRKPDLSTDVIAFAAPTVKVGLETTERMKTAIKRFKEALKEIFPKVELVRPTSGRENKDRLKTPTALEESLKEGFSKVVEIEFTYHIGDPFATIDASEETSDYLEDDPAAKQHVWVDAMDKFRSALTSMLLLEKLLPKDRVRIALIDDGVNLGSVDMYGGIVNVTGLSFHPSDRQTENPWHCSSGGHGTVMANMILRINPWVELFVIKLHCGISHNQGRTISARSAAEALRAAIALNVKIISVSWTIKYRGAAGTSLAPNESGPPNSMKKDAYTDLREAVDEVKKNDIIMFCSASDDIQTSAMKALPYSQQSEHIFRIGAALWLGQRDPTTETPDRIDWYFPGNQVAEAQNPRLQGPVKYHDGSSAGTALAAGLASLIMYLARLVQGRFTETNNMSEAKVFEKFAKDLEDRTKMKQALDMIGKKGNYQQDKKYLPVWSTFNPATEVLTQTKDVGLKWEELARLVKSLCSEQGG